MQPINSTVLALFTIMLYALLNCKYYRSPRSYHVEVCTYGDPICNKNNNKLSKKKRKTEREKEISS